MLRNNKLWGGKGTVRWCGGFGLKAGVGGLSAKYTDDICPLGEAICTRLAKYLNKMKNQCVSGKH